MEVALRWSNIQLGPIWMAFCYGVGAVFFLLFISLLVLVVVTFVLNFSFLCYCWLFLFSQYFPCLDLLVPMLYLQFSVGFSLFILYFIIKKREVCRSFPKQSQSLTLQRGFFPETCTLHRTYHGEGRKLCKVEKSMLRIEPKV